MSLAQPWRLKLGFKWSFVGSLQGVNFTCCEQNFWYYSAVIISVALLNEKSLQASFCIKKTTIPKPAVRSAHKSMDITFILFNMRISLLPSHPCSQSEQAHSFSLAASLDLTWWLRLQECSICMGNKILSVLVKTCFSLLPGFCVTFDPVLSRHFAIFSLSLWDCDEVALPPFYEHNLKHGGNKWFFFQGSVGSRCEGRELEHENVGSGPLCLVS